MTMKKNLFCVLLSAFALSAMTLTSCDKGGGEKENGNEQITLPDESDKTQTVYADDEEKGITFTAQSNWVASVDEAGASRASNVTWIKLLVNGEEKYSGGAGTINLVIVIEPNTTGGDRKATITITCGGEKLNISVDQKGVTEDDKPLTNNDLLMAHPWKLVSWISQSPRVFDDVNTLEDESITDELEYAGYENILTFGNNGKITGLGDNNGVLMPYSISGDTLTFHETYGSISFDRVFTITKLTGSEFEMVAMVEEWWQGPLDGNGNPIKPEGEDYIVTQTMKFVKP